MAALALGKRVGHFTMAYATLLPEQVCRHADLVGSPFCNENGGVTVRAVKQQCVLTVREELIRHRALGHTNDIHGQDCRFGIRIVNIPDWFDLTFIHRLYPLHSIAQVVLGLGQAGVCFLGRLQEFGPVVGRIVYAIF